MKLTLNDTLTDIREYSLTYSLKSMNVIAIKRSLLPSFLPACSVTVRQVITASFYINKDQSDCVLAF